MLWERDKKMTQAAYIKKLIIGVAIASTMALSILSVLPAGNIPEPTGFGSTIQVADKGSDGQETHG